jgi:outer membrane usher protein FimD/PapC
MAPVVRHPMVAVITRGVAMPMPRGAKVRFDDNAPPLVVGHDGMVFIPDLPHAVYASVELGGARCRVHIEPISAKGVLMPRTSPLLCLREAGGVY